jgi:hypothetical protein
MYAIHRLADRQRAVLEELQDKDLSEIRLNFHGARLRIVSNLPTIPALIREGYAFFEEKVGEPQDGGEMHPLFALSCDGPGYAAACGLLFGPGFHPPHCMIPLHFGRIYSISNLSYLTYLTGTFFTAIVESLLYENFLIFHGAAVIRDGIGMMFPGALRCGKTTLTLNLLNRGFGFSSDDIILLKKGENRIYPYPRPINIRQESLTMVDGLHKDYHRMTYSRNLDEPRWFLDQSSRSAEPFRCRYVVFPGLWGTASRLEPLTRSEGALNLIRNSFFPITPIRRYESTGETLQWLSEFLEEAECFALIQGDSGGAVQLLIDSFYPA